MTGLYRKILIATAHSLLLASESRGGAPDRGEGPGSGEVTAVSLAPAAGKAEVVIAVRGAVDVRDFVLASPDRLVLDVVGAKLSDAAPAVYDGVKRGGVLNLRYSQFRPDVVRIVIDLDGRQGVRGRRARASRSRSPSAPTRASRPGSRPRPTPSWSTDEAPAKAGPRSRPVAELVPAPRDGRRRARSPGSPSPGTAPASPTWSPASPPSAAAPSSSARTSRVKSPPR